MILEKGTIAFSLKTQNPFVATMYHVDHYPKGNGKCGPIVGKPYSRDGDFGSNSDWHMYYGTDVPGFPAHPHRGFETITIVLQGTVDHTDGLGSMGRYSDGDVQWMTAGRGLQHAEMFPLLNTDKENPLKLFQIWLSLDREHRMVEPDYRMLWREDIPKVEVYDERGKRTVITVIAGEVAGRKAPPPTQHSWANNADNHLSIHLITMESGASYTIGGVSPTLRRSIYLYEGDEIAIEHTTLKNKEYAFTDGMTDTTITNSGRQAAEILLLESEPIDEPIIARGAYVMTTEEEIMQARIDFRETRFGGWPFFDGEVYHRADQKRFAKYGDLSFEYPDIRS